MTADLRAALESARTAVVINTQTGEIWDLDDCEVMVSEFPLNLDAMRENGTDPATYGDTFPLRAALASTPEPEPLSEPLSFDKSSGKEPAPVVPLLICDDCGNESNSPECRSCGGRMHLTTPEPAPVAEGLDVDRLARARDLVANYCWNEDDSGDEDQIVRAYDLLVEVLGHSTEESVGATLAREYAATSPSPETE